VLIHKRNLVLVHRPKTFKKYEEIVFPSVATPDGKALMMHLSVVQIFGSKCRIKALVEQNEILLRDFENAIPDETMTHSIIIKWRERGMPFVCFVHGDTRECCHAGNLHVVSLKHAMENIDNRTVG
jgi:hypothetical protein